MNRPAIMYGTAWKEDDTRRLVRLALDAGFRAIDTANQRKHYHEVGVGEALTEVYAAGVVRREDLFLQTKFTHRGGQDHRLPYDASAPVAMQVRQSFASSLEHLRTDHVDAYVLHGPSTRQGLASADLEAWSAMEELHATGAARALGISNVSHEQLALLLDRAKVRPAFVQNRCYASEGWDADVRRLCEAHDVVYQGFSLLTANRRELGRASIRTIASRLGRTVEQIVFRFALDVGMLPLTGTTDRRHMDADRAVLDDPPLGDDDRETIAAIGVP